MQSTRSGTYLPLVSHLPINCLPTALPMEEEPPSRPKRNSPPFDLRMQSWLAATLRRLNYYSNDRSSLRKTKREKKNTNEPSTGSRNVYA